MAEFISERFLNQLNQYLEQKPAREPHRGHRVRDLRGGIVNRLRPLSKRSGSGPFCKANRRINDTRYVAVVGIFPGPTVYNSVVGDWHISCDTVAGPAPIIINLPSCIDVGAGKQIAIKDGAGGAAANNITIIPNAILPDAIERGPVFVLNVNLQSVVLISDGVSNWEVIV